MQEMAYIKLIADNIENKRKYIWQVDVTPWSRKCKIKIEDSANPNNVIYSDLFKIKGYALSRITSDDQYDFFLTLRDAWQFPNIAENLWPESWWKQYDYVNGIDPYTGQVFPAFFASPSINAKSNDFTDWPLFVRTFGEDECYHNTQLGHYKAKALRHWRAWKDEWNGSCHGFCMSSLICFDNKDYFLAMFPDLPDFGTLYSVEINDEYRKVINLLMLRQSGKDQWAAIVENYNKSTPRTVLDELRALLRSETREYKTLHIEHLTEPWGHAIVPYRIETANQPGKFDVRIYDCNYPGPNEKLTIDVVQNSWSADKYQGWGGHIYLTGPISIYDGSTVPPLVYSNKMSAENRSVIEQYTAFYNTSHSHISIHNSKGERIGYADSVVTREMGNATPIIPVTGQFHPPIGYRVPAGGYAIEMSSFSDSITYFTFFSDTLIYDCTRMDALSNQTDQFEFGDEFSIKNPDSAPKTFHFEASIIELDNDKVIEVQNFEMNQNNSMKFNVIDREDMNIINTGSKKTYNLGLRFTSAAENMVFKHQGIALETNSSYRISPTWENLESEPVKIYIDLGNDGLIDDTLLISNEYTDVGETQIPLVIEDYQAYQNYPNPFNPSTTISWQ